MKKQLPLYTALILGFSSMTAWSGETCTVSMMGRVCYEEGSEAATAAHMKGNAVAEASSKKKIEVADASKDLNSKKK